MPTTAPSGASPRSERGVSAKGPRRRRLSGLVVNYNTGPFCVACVRSLQREWGEEGRDPADLEVIVVDNASPVDQTPWLEELESLGARVIRADDNLGYAGGMNLALEHSDGAPEDIVAMLNPDLFFLPGAIGAMVDHLIDNPRTGAVDPRATIDPAQRLNLPRNHLPTLYEHTLLNLAQRFPWATRAYSRRRSQLALEWWNTDGPLAADMLSGCCVFLRRAVVEELPYPLLDPRYPLYFEDTDLFRTLARLGYDSVHLGSARVLHHWSRSAGVGASYEGEPHRRQQISQRLYFEKFYGGLGRRFAEWMAKRGAAWEGGGQPLHELTDLGAIDQPPTLEFDRERKFVIEVGLSPKFLLAVGVLDEGRTWRCPDDTWAWWFQGHYFLRALDRESGELLGAWKLVKTAPGRNDPVAVDEEDAIRAAASAVLEASAR
ncbi:MAG: glycosyltransferase family 2 protein [Planctomycetota bacterium]